MRFLQSIVHTFYGHITSGMLPPKEHKDVSELFGHFLFLCDIDVLDFVHGTCHVSKNNL